MSDTAKSAKPISLWPYVLQFSLVYLVTTTAAAVLILATGWQAGRGINIAILVASVIWPMHRFVRDQNRALIRREQLRFATGALLTSSLLGPAVSLAAVAAFTGPRYVVSFFSGFQYVAPSYLILIGALLIVTVLVIFAILYFTSGMVSRTFHRQLMHRGMV